MATRKVFSDENGKELSYHLNSSGKLSIEILMADNTSAEITLDNRDAIDFIKELNKIRKQIK